MKVYKYLQPEHILLGIRRKDKDAVLQFVAEVFERDGVVNDAQLLFESLKEREATMSTGIGKGIGIPHAASVEVEYPAILLIRLADPIDFEALDGYPVDVLLALVVPENHAFLHLQILAGISRVFQRKEFLELVRNAEDPEKLLDDIKQLEEEIEFH